MKVDNASNIFHKLNQHSTRNANGERLSNNAGSDWFATGIVYDNPTIAL